MMRVQTHTPPSNADHDMVPPKNHDIMEPSPVYSPLSSPSQTPRPPPSPPMAPIDSSPPTPAPAPLPPPLSSSSLPLSSKAEPASPKNTDSIALASALRLLMLQRERARKDILLLEELRAEALDQPLEFLSLLNRASPSSPTSPSAPSFSSSTPPTPTSTASPSGRGIPKPQEIYKCPPIEWEKYKILPSPLDKMHEDQQQLRRNVVPSQMHTGGVIGVDSIAENGGIQGRMRLFDGHVVQRGSVVGR